MRIVKEKIRFKGSDVNIKISLSANNELNGLQESINEFIERETGLSINPVDDGEKFRFLPISSKDYEFKFYDGTYDSSLLNAGFTSNEITTQNDVVRNSFYIMQIYDIPNTENQTLLHNGYYNGFRFLSTYGSSSNYSSLNSDIEFTNIYISKSFIDTLSGETTLYAKFNFFNAKTGQLQLFFNENNELLTTIEKIYVEMTLNPSNYTYNITNPIIFKEILNQDYINKINETLDSFDNEKPKFPSGKFFNLDGTYSDI